MGTLMKKLKSLFGRGDAPKKKSTRHKSKHGRGFRTPEEFHADFKNRHGKPGRVPEDVA